MQPAWTTPVGPASYIHLVLLGHLIDAQTRSDDITLMAIVDQAVADLFFTSNDNSRTRGHHQ